MVEVLKQLQYEPMDVTDQVLIIYVGAKGYLDDLAVADVGRFEQQFLKFIREEHRDLHAELKATGELSDQLEQLIVQAIEQFKQAGESNE